MIDDTEDNDSLEAENAPEIPVSSAADEVPLHTCANVGLRPSTLISLGTYNDSDILTKKELCAVFSCGARTLQRMVERFELPPPIWLGGRKVWIVGNLRAWIDEIAKRHEKEAARVARKMRIFID